MDSLKNSIQNNLQVEDLDVCNIIEIERIRELLIHEPDLLCLFEILIIIVNKRINDYASKPSLRNAD